MFLVKFLVVTTLLICSIINMVLVESSIRQKKDVHHMIILNEQFTSPRNQRYKTFWYNASKPKRRPAKKSQHLSSPIEENRKEDEKNREPKHEHSYKHYKAKKQTPPFSYSNGKPITPVKLFEPYQRIPMEITTPLSLSDTFLNLKSTLYPPLSSGFDMAAESSIVRTVKPYKPFDYSLLGQQRITQKPDSDLSIVIDNSAEKEDGVKKSEEVRRKRKKKGKRGRGLKIFRIRTIST